MNPEELSILEQEGIKVITKTHLDPHFRTRTFVKLQDGRLLAHYDKLSEIPNTLNDGDAVTLFRTAVPEEVRNVDGLRSGLWKQEYAVGDPPKLIGIFMIAIFFIISAALFVLAITLVQTILAPCGPKPYEKEISQCWKVIIMPNCDYRSFNSCADPDGDGDPEGEWGEDDWQKGGTDYLMWMVIGIVAIGGIWVLSRIFKSRERERYYAVYPEERPSPKSVSAKTKKKSK